MFLLRKSIEYARWLLHTTKGFRGVVALIVLLRTVSGLMMVAAAIATQRMVDAAVTGNGAAALQAGLVFFSFILGHQVLDVISEIQCKKNTEKLSQRLRERYFSDLMMADWLAVSQHHSGDWVMRLSTNVQAISSTVLGTFPEAIALLIQFIAAFITLMFMEPALALLAFLIGPLALVFANFFGRKLGTLQDKSQESESKWRTYLQDALQHLLVYKAFRLERHAITRLKELHAQRMHWAGKEIRTSSVMGSAISSGYWLGYLLAFGWGVWRLTTHASSFGTLTAFLQLVEQVQGPFVGLSYMIPQIIWLATSMKRLRFVEQMPAEKIKDKTSWVVVQGNESDDSVLNSEVETLSDSQSIEESLSCSHIGVGVFIRELTFGYNSDRDVFRDFSLDIQPGEIVAISGPSGRGKTTLIRLLLDLVHPIKGTIVYQGRVGSVATSVVASVSSRELISYVPQGNTLISGSIRDNLHLGNPDATDEEMWAAIRIADAEAFVLEQADGLDTLLGEGASGLSEGQAQRLSIARALLKNAPLLLMDEATASLDQETEERVLKNIRYEKSGCTCLFITHRATAWKICDRVVEL